MTNVHCTSCGSDDTAAVEATYLAGTHQTSTRAVGFIGDDIAVGGASGTSMSLLAARLAPPAQRSTGLGGVIACLVVGALLVIGGIANISSADRRQGPGVGIVILVSGAIVMLVGLFLIPGFNRARQFNSQELPVLLKRWRAQWMCRRCGAVFTPLRDKSTTSR